MIETTEGTFHIDESEVVDLRRQVRVMNLRRLEIVWRKDDKEPMIVFGNTICRLYPIKWKGGEE